MAAKTSVVNLDAMIPRSDFSLTENNVSASYAKPQQIAITDLMAEGFICPLLRKPDFQRETNHWSAEQVVSLLECLVNGDLIPSVIIWKSPTYFFVIDGGHRLSVIRAWIEDDYGDGPISRAYFEDAISKEQKRAAAKTRALVAEKVGTWGHLQTIRKSKNPEQEELRRISTIAARAMHVQWVEGNAEKAEQSFFKINTQGTALDDIEELLLSNRAKPIAIASRAIIRAGKGHRYWSRFESPLREDIERLAKKIHDTLFQPEIEKPIKTLDLPLGGSTGVRTALQVLIPFTLSANQNQAGEPKELKDQADDPDGSATKECLTKTFKLATRMTGNEPGSLGLHPAIYFYGPTGRHLTPMFLGVSALLSRKLINNDDGFFAKFTRVRERLEAALIEHKDLIATVLQKTLSRYRVKMYANLLDDLVTQLNENPKAQILEADVIKHARLSGKVITGLSGNVGAKFSDETKSAAFISSAMIGAMKCPICRGYLDPQKSISYDHKTEVAVGGRGGEENCQLTHPYCNHGVKNKSFSQKGRSNRA